MTVNSLKDMTSFKWATVRGVSPLSIQLDGDPAPLALIPDSLIDPLSLIIGDRVRVELSLRKVVIHGRANGSSGVEAGRLEMTAAAGAPAGWLLCQGQSLLRASYASLYAAIGVVYGSVDGTHFNVPDLRGRTIVGQDSSQTEFDTLGEKAGAKTHTLSVAEIPSHSHASPAGGQYWVGGGTNIFGGGTLYSATLAAATGQNAGGGGAHNNLQPYIVLNYIIKI